METTTRQIKYFLFSQYLADGIRITLEIILPVIVFAQLGNMEIGLTLATGAFCVSITDTPGPLEHKRNGMLYCIAFVTATCLLTGLLNHHVLLLGLMIAAATFFFSMFSVFGNRAGLVGTASLLVMILRMPAKLSELQVIEESLLVMAGGLWYMIIAILFFRLTPYRPAQRALGDCIHEIAKYFRLKSDLYNTQKDFETTYRAMLTQQVSVNEKQDALREMLFKDKDLMKEPTKTGRLLVLTFADTIDLYEQIMATWYDYNSLRKRFAHTGLLHKVSVIINDMAEELDHTGLAIQSNTAHNSQYEFIPALDQLKNEIDALSDLQSKLVLRKILVNLRNLGYHIKDLQNYFSARISEKGNMRSTSDYARFVSHQEIDITIFKNNLNLRSSIFRHSLRVMITCLAGFLLTKMISYGHHSYWVLLTTIVILKPGFSLTRQRNRERLIGTILGGLIAIVLLYFIQNRDALFGLIIFFMIGTYTFQRLNYAVMVVFITPYILILFNLLGLGFIDVAGERLIDTAIACTLAFLANYFLFPQWESQQAENYMMAVLKANIGYLEKLKDIFSGKTVTLIEYKLSRKALYTSTANLSAAFQRMLSEPKHKQKNGKLLYEFMMLNNVLASNIASLSANLKTGNELVYPKEIILPIKRSIRNLQSSIEAFAPSQPMETITEPQTYQLPNIIADHHLLEQVHFINKVSVDIERITKEFLGTAE